MPLKKLPEDVGGVQLVRRFSDHPLGQAVFAPWPGVPHPFDDVKNDFGLSITRPVVESFDAVLVTRDFRAEGAAYHLRPRQKRLAERSEEHTSELQSPCNLVCRLLPEKNKHNI